MHVNGKEQKSRPNLYLLFYLELLQPNKILIRSISSLPYLMDVSHLPICQSALALKGYYVESQNNKLHCSEHAWRGNFILWMLGDERIGCESHSQELSLIFIASIPLSVCLMLCTTIKSKCIVIRYRGTNINHVYYNYGSNWTRTGGNDNWMRLRKTKYCSSS